MNYGLYSAFLGMRARQRTLETIANNIANASTSGFKADRLFHHSIELAEASLFRARDAGLQLTPEDARAQAARQLVLGPSTIDASSATPGTPTPNTTFEAANPPDSIARVFGLSSGGVTDFTAGVMRETGRPLDVALDGEGFFVVQTPRGERYTRAGALTVDASGQLVTQRGELIVSEGGPITIRQGKGELSIGADGSVSVDKQTVGKLRVVRFDNAREALAKEGDSLFMATGKEQPQDANGTRVVQGVLELSNVNAVTEMATMMHNSREFDSLQRSITLMMNDIGRKIATEIGRV
ncbi:MAG: flagellar basal-body rod protein FlgF [Blastocatellia bacterium]|nr:flagellar basal-body rod protein FlgF [Blastocatellia bacterium]